MLLTIYLIYIVIMLIINARIIYRLFTEGLAKIRKELSGEGIVKKMNFLGKCYYVITSFILYIITIVILVNFYPIIFITIVSKKLLSKHIINQPCLELIKIVDNYYIYKHLNN